jgi:hypothetical protein
MGQMVGEFPHSIGREPYSKWDKWLVKGPVIYGTERGPFRPLGGR